MSLLKFDLRLILTPAHSPVPIIVPAFSGSPLFRSLLRIGQHGLAFLKDLVVGDYFLVLIAFVLGERIRILCFILEPHKFFSVMLSFLLVRLDQLLLLKYHLLQRPTSLHPHLKDLLELLISHLPSFDFFSDSSCLALHGGNFNFQCIRIPLDNNLDVAFEFGFSSPCLSQHVFEPRCQRNCGLFLLGYHDLLHRIGQ